jgi:hypothetical protein
LATKLAPAKAHVVELDKILHHTLPNLAGPPKSCLEGRPATPYRLSRRRRIHVKHPLLTLDKKASEESTARRTQHATPMPSSSVMSNLRCEHAIHSPPSPPITSTSFNDCEEGFRVNQNGGAESDSVDISRSIIDSIYDAVRGFPQHMLSLDTPCLVEIRRQNHFAQDTAATQCLSTPSPNSTIYSLPLDQLQRRPSRPRVTTAKFFTPLLRASLTKNFLPQNKGTSLYNTRTSSRKSTGSRFLSQSDPPPPNLSAFQHIFPSTQDWWKTALYAHLIAYNYICGLQAISQCPISELPPKASRTLGISGGCSTHFTPTPVLDARLVEIEMELVSCITWITNCIAGKINAQTDTKKVRNWYERDHILVRALAEIVKVSVGIMSHRVTCTACNIEHVAQKSSQKGDEIEPLKPTPLCNQH